MKIDPTKTVSELINTISYVTNIEGKKNIYHAWRVAIISAKLARKKTDTRLLKCVFYASLLHDIGGVGFPFHIIHYLKRKDKTSRNILLSHPIIGAQLVSNIPQMNEIARLILDHHEWINGAGYPRAKIKKYIPLGSQIIRMGDAIDILLQTGRYRNLKKMEDKLSLNIGKEYSQDLFDAGLKALKEDRLFHQITGRRNTDSIFKKTSAAVGLIPIPFKIDAIGKTLEFVAQIIDMRHPYSAGHSLRVSRYALAIALAMRLEHDEVTRIKWAGLIHDIGKINISRYIMNKPTKLTEKEFLEVKKHASHTRKIMGMLPSLKEIVEIASDHHEYFNGSGYPQGLKGNEAPLGARILVVCDAFDAMTSNRPYRTSLTPSEACQEIKRLAGQQFDPEIAKISIPLFKNLGL
ncbi:MAG: HD domain-containing protein [Candidatus Omnitrophica bacterium]|nr:HD domain-containing protein [Candidatus Omnitrophota bacterium]MDD5592119.1 HD domain-containing protein [Candidatus Omnitrophota bacterium]